MMKGVRVQTWIEVDSRRLCEGGASEPSEPEERTKARRQRRKGIDVEVRRI